jgi:hypothetical protein
MKKIKLYILALAAGLLLVPQSCSKEFLETAPTDQLSGNLVFSSVAGAWGALNGVHRSMYIQYNSSQAHGGMAGMYLYIDMIGTDIVFNTTANGWYRSAYQWVDHRNDRSSMVLYWTNLYRLVSNINQIITQIDGIAGSEAEKKAIKGQALTYRAWAHFMLVQLFAERFTPGGANTQPGVPYMESITFDGQPRNSVADVYSKINADLTQAITLLEGYNRANKSHINKSVALAIQAQVALVQGNWAQAATSANAARQGYSFMSAAQHLEGYSKQNNPENLWASYVQEDQTMYFYSFYAYMSNNFNSTAIRQSPKSITKELYDKISDTDIRKGFWYPNAVADKQPFVQSNGVRFNYMSSKFQAVSSADGRGDFPWIRVAEMYLIEAEALARQAGKETQARDVLYLLAKNRDPQYTLSTNSGQDLINEILTQRRIELWGEGRNWTDLKRLNLPLVRSVGPNAGQGFHVESYAIKIQEPAGTLNWNWMIPKAEIDTNPELEQNPV